MQIEQIDREAALAWKESQLAELQVLMSDPPHHLIEAFARHRHQARAEVVREIVAWLNDLQEGRTSDNYPGYYARQIESKFGGHE